MGLAATLARRSLLGHPGRTLFSVLGVALGIATVVAVFTVDHVTVLSRTRWLEDADFGADLEVRAKPGATEPREELLKLQGVAGVATFFTNDVRLRPVAPVSGADEPEERSVRLIAIESGQAGNLGVYHVDRGRNLDPAGDPRGCLIGRRLAEELGLAPGDPVLLAPPLRAAKKRCIEGEMRVVGEAESPPEEEAFTVAGVLARENIGRRSKGNVVVVDFDAGRRLFHDLHVEPAYWLARDETVDLEALEADLNHGFTFERNQSAAVGQMADERAFRNGVRMAGLFALLLGLFVIFHTLSMSLLERVKEVGTLHALGTTTAQIARVFFSEALVVALLAGALGFAGGLGIARLLLEEGITTLGVRDDPVGPFAVPWHVALPLTLLGVGIALVGSIFPILSARGTDVVTILRGEDSGPARRGGRGFHVVAVLLLVVVLPALFFLVVPVVGAAVGTLVRMVLLGLAVLGTLFFVALLLPEKLGALTSRAALLLERRAPLPALLASRSLARSPTRIGASIAAVALVTAAFVGLEGMTNSLRAEIEVWADRAVQDKLFVDGLPSADLDELRADLHRMPEVLAVEQGDARAEPSFRLLGLRAEELAGFGPCAEDPALSRGLEEGQGLIVSDRLARQRELEPGDVVLVNTSGHGVQEFRVLAVSDAYGFTFPDERAYAVTSDRHMARFFCLDVRTTGRVSVKLREGTDPELVEAALRARFPGARLGFSTGAQVRAFHLFDIDRDFVLFDVILLLTALLAGLGVLNGQLLAALERRKELGVLRALGMTRGQLAGAVLLESGVLGVAGGLLGLAVGSALTPILVSSLRVLSGLDLPLRGAGPTLALFLVGASGLALVAGLYPIWRMNRMDAVRAVRTG